MLTIKIIVAVLMCVAISKLSLPAFYDSLRDICTLLFLISIFLFNDKDTYFIFMTVCLLLILIICLIELLLRPKIAKSYEKELKDKIKEQQSVIYFDAVKNAEYEKILNELELYKREDAKKVIKALERIYDNCKDKGYECEEDIIDDIVDLKLAYGNTLITLRKYDIESVFSEIETKSQQRKAINDIREFMKDNRAGDEFNEILLKYLQILEGKNCQR